MARLIIDGKVTDAPPESTVLEVARRAGVAIPTFCDHAALAPMGACRLCVVEVEGPELPRTVLTSCTLPASEGLVVETDTPRLRRYRRTILELLLASLPPGEALAALARRFGVPLPAGAGAGADACALCGLCVRACHDRMGPAALAFRGSDTNRWKMAERIALDAQRCVGCATCAALCPTGAIAVEDGPGERRMVLYGEVVARLELAACASCGAPHATRPFLDLVRSRLRAAGAVEAKGSGELCPACARAAHAPALTGNGLALED